MIYKTKGELALHRVDAVMEYARCRKAGVYPFYFVEYEDPTFSYPHVDIYNDTREAIQYECGRSRYNGCTHTKCKPFPLALTARSKSKTYTTDELTTNWTIWYAKCGVPEGVLSFQGLRTGSPGPLPVVGVAPPDWSNLVYGVGSQLDGRMQTSQNLLVDIMQIAQTVNMFKDPLGLRRLHKQGRTGTATLSQLWRNPANNWLEYQFGWKNIYRSFAALRDVWSEVRAHQAYLQSAVDKYTSIANRQSSVANNPSIGMSSVSFNGSGYVLLVPKISKIEANYCFSLDVLRDAQSCAWSRMDQVMSRLGVRDIADALWDCVPYSFVVDWFTHVNRLIERRSVDYNSHRLKYVGYSLTTRHYGYLQVTQKETIAVGSDTYTYNTGSSVVQSTYQRVAGFPPETSSVGLFGDLNMTQLSEGAALIIQRI